MKKFILTLTMLLCVVGFSGCSEETSFEAFNNCNCVDNPQEAIIGLWKMTGAFTADGSRYYSGYNSCNPFGHYVEFRSDGFIGGDGKPPERTYQIFQDSIVLYWIPPENITDYDPTNFFHCYKYCLTDNNNELIVQHIWGILEGNSCLRSTIFIYKRRQ